MKQTKAAHKLVAPFLTLLGEKIRKHGFTESEVEEALSWNKGHLEQLMAGRRSLCVDQLSSILGVIGVEPKAFFAERYGMSLTAEELRTEIAELSTLADSLADLLVKNKVITASALARVVAARAGNDLLSEDS